MRIDFFGIEMPDGSPPFSDVLAIAAALPDDASRVQDIAGVPFRLQSLARSSRLWEGEIVRIRMNDIPIIVSRGGDVDEVELDQDEGLGEETAFLYDEKTKVLVFQKNRFGVPESKFARYCELVGRLSGAILPAIILRRDIATELSRLKIVKKLQVRFSGVSEPKLITKHNPSTTDAIKLLDATAPVMDITLSVGRSRGSLGTSAVAAAKRFAKWAQKAMDGGDGAESVESVKILGTLDDDSEADLDLLEYRMYEKADVQADPRSRRLLYADRKLALKQAFDRHRADLELMFP